MPTPKTDLSRARQSAELLRQQALYDRWFSTGGLEAFCWEACRTKDEHDFERSIKPLPDVEFLHFMFKLFQSERWINIAKSRQVFCTWAVFIYSLWRILARPNQTIALIPKKQQDGERHIEDRLKNTLWQNLPGWLKDRYTIAPLKGSFHVLAGPPQPNLPTGEPWGSFLVCYPQGADQLRGATHSVVIGDEVAHQPGHAEWWKAAIPTIQERGGKGGQIIQLSSAKRGSFFQKQLTDRVRDAVKLAKAVP